MATRPNADDLHAHALREAEALRRMVEEISSELELRPLLTRIVTHACDLLGADDGSIGLFDPVKKVIRTEAVYRMPLREAGRRRSGPALDSPARCSRAAKPVVLDALRRAADHITLPELAGELRRSGCPSSAAAGSSDSSASARSPPRLFDEQDLSTLRAVRRVTLPSPSRTPCAISASARGTSAWR